MPRSTNSRGLRGRKAQTSVTEDAAVIVDEVQDEAVEAALDKATATEPAPFAAQYDWDTATWTPRKGNGVRPCLCNKLNGYQCELTTKSRFATGHDARFKGILQKAFRMGKRLDVDFGPEDNASVTDAQGNRVVLDGTTAMDADDIARMLAPNLLRWVTHDTRAAKLQRADSAAGTTVPQTAVDARPDEELTDADVEAQVDDAADVEAQFQEA